SFSLFFFFSPTFFLSSSPHNLINRSRCASPLPFLHSLPPQVLLPGVSSAAPARLSAPLSCPSSRITLARLLARTRTRTRVITTSITTTRVRTADRNRTPVITTRALLRTAGHSAAVQLMVRIMVATITRVACHSPQEHLHPACPLARTELDELFFIQAAC
ncbi:hypothetical protein BKA62DRAFT_86744, partial [Auriculariales sp. MPI-PUGE-AT-0066]